MMNLAEHSDISVLKLKLNYPIYIIYVICDYKSPSCIAHEYKISNQIYYIPKFINQPHYSNRPNPQPLEILT